VLFQFSSKIVILQDPFCSGTVETQIYTEVKTLSLVTYNKWCVCVWVKMSFDWILAISYHTGSLRSYQHQLAKSWQHLRQTQSNHKYRRRKT